MRNHSAIFLLTCALCAAPPASRADQGADAPLERPRIGLVLSGGGARGAAHAGILKLLEENRVPVDFVAGTSFGALVGGFYAAGMSPNEIIDWIEELDWQVAAGDRPPRRALSFRRKQDDYTYALRVQVGYRDGRVVLPRGLIGAQELGFRLRMQTLHTARWPAFDDMPIPFRAVATDIERGESVVLDHGALADALLASMAVPGVIAPVEIDGRILVDGGLTENIPVRVAREMGADIVIVVDTSTQLAGRHELEDVIGVSAQVITLLGQESIRSARESLGTDDVLVVPDLSGIGSGDFNRMGEAIERGLAAGPVVTPRLQALSLDPEAWQAWVARHRGAPRDAPQIDYIEVDNQTALPDALILARVSHGTGVALSPRHLRRDVSALYSLGEFDRVDFHLVERDGSTGLRISVSPRDLGPLYVRFGLNIQDDLGGDSAYNLQLLTARTQLNRLNGEWRNEFQIGETRRIGTEFFQPLTVEGDWFVQPSAAWSASRFDLFDDGLRVGRYEVRRRAASLNIGWQWRNIGQISAGAFREGVGARPRIGAAGLPRIDDRVAGWQWRVIADQLDDWSFPADAWYAELDGRHGRDMLGGTREYGRVGFTVAFAWELSDRDRLLWSVRGGARVNGVLPLYEQFTLGGFLSLSGLRQQELRGDYMFMTRVVMYRRLFSLPAGLGEGFYAGLSHERGNTWIDRSDVGPGDLRWGSAVFIGADLVFGALYLGAGRADNGDMSGYLFLQRSFQ
ncbi:MAG: patatin-like phospholipase family protein [Xanthomonadaceae bacterium]|nr:patatin-like phospholipase family protein [Xanthomonadaceae bacterium]